MSIWIVWACWNYEGNDIMKAFVREEDATTFRLRCEAHHALKPHLPDDSESPEWDAAWLKYEEWQQQHPATTNAHADSFSQSALEVEGEKP